ncbi:STAS/SEC14 domain-containing protein [Bosea caraganae]|uniref:STAS/SEC14 domain-containing protein n=1 Tax=Bosea caraganae TaxID=2763117 RepID=A0A370L1X5_9HYPH|nr:STAS/SEC14 domain-containing protein [Bosea caraganae]RDJ22117.1 STAS/SEC14 domain-containing protein [Bosea caraganae]RDJ22796.1 STAS/SEC14 domain-containing protein [Bosea caraganae]
MFEILAAPDHVAAYRLSGTLTPEDYDGIIADIEARLQRHEKIGVLADLTGFHDITFRATAKDLRYSFSKLSELKRFPREAIISNKGWIATLASIASPLVPYVEIKAFKPEEFEAALIWAADIEGGPNA